jgi:SAM-dependent methyltransferase
LRLDDAELVRPQYASEEKLAPRSRAWREWLEGENPEDVAFGAVAEQRPERVLEVGCGEGECAERLGRRLRVDVVAIDLSPRMVELARAWGVDARVGDLQKLPFDDGSFDVAVANWISDENLGDLWERIGDVYRKGHPFTRENGTEALARHFADVELRPVDATVVFPNSDAVVQYVRASITRRYLADRVPELEGPIRARAAHGVLVGQKAA